MACSLTSCHQLHPFFFSAVLIFLLRHPHSSVWVKLLALLAHSSWPFQVFHLVLPVAVWRHLYWTAHLSILHPSVIPFFPVFSSRYVPRDSSLSPFCSSVYCATICVCELVCVYVCFGLLWSVSPTLFMLCCSFPLLSLLHLLHLFFFFADRPVHRSPFLSASPCSVFIQLLFIQSLFSDHQLLILKLFSLAAWHMLYQRWQWWMFRGYLRYGMNMKRCNNIDVCCWWIVTFGPVTGSS